MNLEELKGLALTKGISADEFDSIYKEEVGKLIIGL